MNKEEDKKLLEKQIEIFARNKQDKDEYKETILANLQKQEDGKLRLVINPKSAAELLKEVGVEWL